MINIIHYFKGVGKKNKQPKASGNLIWYFAFVNGRLKYDSNFGLVCFRHKIRAVVQPLTP